MDVGKAVDGNVYGLLFCSTMFNKKTAGYTLPFALLKILKNVCENIVYKLRDTAYFLIER